MYALVQSNGSCKVYTNDAVYLTELTVEQALALNIQILAVTACDCM